MLAWVDQDFEGLRNALQRNDGRRALVGWNRHLEVPDPVLVHEANILLRIVLRDESTNACQLISQ